MVLDWSEDQKAFLRKGHKESNRVNHAKRSILPSSKGPRCRERSTGCYL